MSHLSSPLLSSEDKSSKGDDVSLTTKTREKAKTVLLKTKEKAKSVLPTRDSSHVSSDEDIASEIGRELSSDPAFKPSLTPPTTDEGSSKQPSSSVKSGLESAKRAVTHPRALIGEKSAHVAAGKLSDSHSPFVTTSHDRNLVDAHDELEATVKNTHSDETSVRKGDHHVKALEERITNIQSERESHHTAWVLGRHVSRVVNAQATPSGSLSDDLPVLKRVPRGTLQEIQRCAARYVDDVDNDTFDVQDLTLTFERFVHSSSGLQAWLGEVKRVCSWEDPRRTAKWLCVYAVLWYFQYLVAYVYGYMIYTAVKNLLFPTTVDDARKSLDKAKNHPDSGAPAWADIVQQHGDKEWIRPLLESVGPTAQLQLGDFTDLIESTKHFFSWTSPKQTIFSLFFLSSCLLICFVADMAFCVKLVELLAGGWFFFCAPIAMRCPKYRRVVLPARWALWGVPTEAEAAIAVLQKRVVHIKAKKGLSELTDSESASESDYETAGSNEDAQDDSQSEYERDFGAHQAAVSLAVAESATISSFRALQHGAPGRLTIHTAGIRFQSPRRRWSASYQDLIEMVKDAENSKRKKVAKGPMGGSLELTFRGPATSELQKRVLNVKKDDRDEIFNLVLAWSGLKWRTAWAQRPKEEGSQGKARFFDALY